MQILSSHDVQDGTPVGMGGGQTPMPVLFEDADLLAFQTRALAYVSAGIPVLFRGPSGIGKSTLALQVARRVGRPVAHLTGDPWITRDDLVGRAIGTSERQIDDSYIQRVRRTERQARRLWRDGALLRAMRHGHTLIYDEFTRTSPEANALLLSAIEERRLAIVDPDCDTPLVPAHPDFRVILVSNPQGHVGVQPIPEALMDRIVTLDVPAPDADTEIGMICCRSGLGHPHGAALVRMIRRLRDDWQGGPPPSTRTAILIARLLAAQSVPADPSDARYVRICLDVLNGRDPADEARLLSGILSSGTVSRTDPKGPTS